MKTIQITIDPELLHKIDNDKEAMKKGRSGFLRQAVQYYLEQKRLKSISEQYCSGYRRESEINDDLISWENEQLRPKT
jgi:metal-responsive CopG/Arc/MetJ family transcriptional regulator